MSLPLTARRRAARDLEVELQADPGLPAGVIPIDDAPWDRFVARFTPMVEDLLELEPRVNAAAEAEDVQLIRRATEEVATSLRTIHGHLRAAVMFDHPRRDRVVRLGVLMRALAGTWKDTVVLAEATPSHPVPCVDTVRAALVEIASCQDVEWTDPWLRHFGVSKAQLHDADGRFSPPLLVASFHGRPVELMGGRVGVGVRCRE